MGVISRDKNLVKLYFNSNNSIDKKVFANVKASEKKFLAIDLSKDKVTGTQWAEITGGLGLEIRDLINTLHPDFVKEYGTDTMVMRGSDWLKVLEGNPYVLASPIVVIGEKFHMIKKPSEINEFL